MKCGSLFMTNPLPEIHPITKQSSLDDCSFQYPNSFKNQDSLYFTVKPWYTHFRDIPNSSMIELTRLRFRHSRLPPHMFHIRISSSSTCYFHPQNHSRVTLNHILLEFDLFTHPTAPIFYCNRSSIPTLITASDLISTHNINIFNHIWVFSSKLPAPSNF